MNYIWEAVLDKKQDVYFEQADRFCPYYEVSQVLPSDKDGKVTVVYNSLFRYEDIFAPLLYMDSDKAQWKKKLFDVVTHILAEQECKSGQTRKEVITCHIMRQIENNVYGESIKERYLKLEPMQKHRLAGYMAEQIKSNASAALYVKALIGLWETGVVYKNAEKPKMLLVYAGEKKNERLENIAKLVQDIFLPLDYNVRIFWKTHFGIIGKPDSLKLEQIELF